MKTLPMFAVSSSHGIHAFYTLEIDARRHWKNSRKYDIQYEIVPMTVTYSIKKMK